MASGSELNISVIVPTLDAAKTLETTLRGLHEISDIIVVDGGSVDATIEIATECGARVVRANKGRGQQLAAGADAATSDWLLFLHADTILSPGWLPIVMAFAHDVENQNCAAAFRFKLDSTSLQARCLERCVAVRASVLGLPYGDQGLLLHRGLYRTIGGYKSLPIMEDVDLVRRIGRSRLVILRADAVTSAVRWQEQGWTRRSTRNLLCLSMFFAGVPPRIIARVYGAA
jgi:rSAM/selenodomain-associated transferase 2